jgi:hypothetical protein
MRFLMYNVQADFGKVQVKSNVIWFDFNFLLGSLQSSSYQLSSILAQVSRDNEVRKAQSKKTALRV